MGSLNALISTHCRLTTTTFNIIINYCSHNMGSSVHQSPARICAKFRLKKSRSIKPRHVLSMPFGQEKIQQSNIHIPKVEDILIICNLRSLAKCWNSSEHVEDLLQVLVVWQDSDCWFSNQWHGSPNETHTGGFYGCLGSFFSPIIISITLSMVKKHPEGSGTQWPSKTNGGVVKPHQPITEH